VAAHKFTKKNMKQDSFLSSTEKALEFLQRNATVVGIGLLALVVVLVGGSYWQQSQEASRVEASYMLFQGQTFIDQGDFEGAVVPLRDCVEEHGGTDFGRYARVALVHALLGAGEVDQALAAADRYAYEIPADHPAVTELALIRATALADAGRPAEAAAAMESLISADLPDNTYIQRSLRRVQWLREAGDRAAAVAVLEELRDAAAAGEITPIGTELERELERTRALLD